ncbi:hypothetical protein CYY_000037 [Polysphondylium violaceum]|uniref:Arf-GAP domain-containing protein n=1 Tax=Polysphondylium violaceum TaxID=133409 RepID=A0A8J4Q2L0_9MYCE|nr:hypothetical protein CYY_000037 [Polysphondylium violaceum]
MDKNELLLFQLRELEENSKCADCTDSFPRYMNTTHGTFVCSVCGAIHRELGNRVKSIASDKFTEQDLEKLKNIGNKMATELWLSKWNQKEYPLPHPNEEKKVREFIKLKYLEKKWLKNGVKEEEIITMSITPNRSTPTTQSTITSPIQNRGETKANLDSKSSLSKEFESLNLGTADNSVSSSSTTTTSTASYASPTAVASSSTSSSSNSKPFNPFREENAYFTTNNTPKSTSDKPQFPPFSERPFDQHSYLNNKDIHSGFDKKIKLQTAAPRSPPTSVYDKKPNENNNSMLQLEYQQQDQLQQFNNNYNNNNMMGNQQPNYGNPFDINNNMMNQQQFNNNNMNNSMNGMNNNMNNSMSGMNYNQQQQNVMNNNNMNNSMNGMNYNQQQPFNMNNSMNGVNPQQQLVIQQNPFNNMEDMKQYHQQLHQQNMMQQQYSNQPTTTTTTITTVPMNPYQQQREVPLDEMFGKKIEGDPIFPAHHGGSFESGNNIDSADEEQKRAWNEIESKKQQFLKDRELAKALQREEEEIAKSRPRANTEPTRRANNYSSYRPQNNNSRPSFSSSNSRRGRSRSSDYDDPFETAPEAYNMSAYNNSRANNNNNGNFDDYDNYMRKNPRIAQSSNYDPNRNYGYKNQYQSPPQHQRSYSNDEYQIQPYNSTQELAIYQQLTECEHCGKRVELEGMSYHKNTECILRQCRCKYCNKLVKQLTMADHEAACQNKTYTCGVCGKMILGREMPSHMSFVHNS